MNAHLTPPPPPHTRTRTCRSLVAQLPQQPHEGFQLGAGRPCCHPPLNLRRRHPRRHPRRTLSSRSCTSSSRSRLSRSSSISARLTYFFPPNSSSVALRLAATSCLSRSMARGGGAKVAGPGERAGDGLGCDECKRAALTAAAAVFAAAERKGNKHRKHWWQGRGRAPVCMCCPRLRAGTEACGPHCPPSKLSATPPIAWEAAGGSPPTPRNG